MSLKGRLGFQHVYLVSTPVRFHRKWHGIILYLYTWVKKIISKVFCDNWELDSCVTINIRLIPWVLARISSLDTSFILLGSIRHYILFMLVSGKKLFQKYLVTIENWIPAVSREQYCIPYFLSHILKVSFVSLNAQIKVTDVREIYWKNSEYVTCTFM